MAAAINETYLVKVVPTLASGESTAMDRWIPSYLAYQCSARQHPIAMKIALELLDMQEPDLYIYCKVSPEVAKERLAKRNDGNYLDDEAQDFKDKVAQGYEDFFTGIGSIMSTVITLDCDQSLEVVEKQLHDELLNYIKTKEKA